MAYSERRTVERMFSTLADASKDVQYGCGPGCYVPEDRTYFANTYNDIEFYKIGLDTLRTVNPELEFPLPIPVSFTENKDRKPRHASDLDRYEIRAAVARSAAKAVRQAACQRMLIDK